MLIVDIRKSVPLDVSWLDWDPNHIGVKEDGHTITIPLYDITVMKEVGRFAYDIASRQPWVWPDWNDIAMSIVCDVMRSFPRFSLRISVRPTKDTDDEITKEWAEFEDQRRDCLLYTSDAADERSSVDLGGRRIIKKKKR